MRASDGTKPHYRAYCDKHSPAQRERDIAKGVPPAVVPGPPELVRVESVWGVGFKSQESWIWDEGFLGCWV